MEKRLVLWCDANGVSAAGDGFELESGLAGAGGGASVVGGVVSEAAGVFPVAVDGGDVSPVLVEEREGDVGVVGLFACHASDEPVVAAFRLSGYGDICCRLSFEIDGFVPIDGYVFDELEGIGIALIALRHVGCHL